MGSVLNEMEDVLMHYGMPRRSGRYPWGSGENPYQHSGDFLSRVYELRKQNFTYTDETGKVWSGDTAIAKSMGLTSTQLRVQMSLAKDERRSLQVATAKGLREKGYSLNEIAEKMGFANDSSVRSLLNENAESRMRKAQNVADILRKELETKKMIDVGAGVERELGVSREKLEEALYILQMDGYPVYGGGVAQATNKGKQTNLKVLCQPGTEHKEMYEYGEIQSLIDYTSDDGGETFRKAFQYPESMDSSRLSIRYAEDGGINKDGVIELRRGVADLSLGESNYAQVRILVDGNKYIKGMAVYGDDADFPPGVDVIFNTNKKSSVSKMDVLKPISDDPDNPFGSLIKEHGGQSTYTDKDGKEHLSLINKRAEEGDWGDWSDNLPSQFLSKQSMQLIKKQLNLAASDKEAEFAEICALTNPTVKKRLLQSFSDDCDAAAVHLKAAALPRQKYQVILPLTSIKDTEVYAPNYHDGETVALIRYPHGGTFEIPILKVNNKLSEGQKVIGKTPADAIGIHKNVADRLSGADFDGDTVMVIPCNSSRSKVKITSTNPLKQDGSRVLHGAIREVSLVLAGANPGAFINSIMAHGEETDEAEIYNGLDYIEAPSEEDTPDEDAGEPAEDDSEPIVHADGKDDEKKEEGAGETLEDVFNTLTQKQKNTVYAMVGDVADRGGEENHSNENKGGNDDMKHNAFEGNKPEENYLSHADQEKILAMAKSSSIGTFKDALEIYTEQNSDTLAHGIESIEMLFPEFKDVRPGAPELLTTDQGWIAKVLAKVHKSPISRIRTRQADVRDIEKLRAKGYKKGKEKGYVGNFKLLHRTTDPQTIYVKSKLDRDDIIDITDFDVVQYLYGIDRMNLNEELATSIMLGDGREDGDEGKIYPDKIRPVWLDDELYTIHADVDIAGMKASLQGTNTGANFGENYIYAEAVIQSLSGVYPGQGANLAVGAFPGLSFKMGIEMAQIVSQAPRQAV